MIGHEGRQNQLEQQPDKELERVEKFQRTLSETNIVLPFRPEFDFEEDLPVRNAIDRFLLYEAQTDTTLYIDPSFHSNITDNNLTFSPLVSRGGKRSAHGVFFGDLYNDNNHIATVAVKPHEVSGIDSCLNDYANTLAVQDLGIFSVQSLGFIMNKNKKAEAYSFTILEETLTTLDSIDWSKYYPTTDINPGMHEMWRVLSDQLAVLHDGGNISHGDMAARNIATIAEQEGSDSIFFIDWEMARISKLAPRDAEVRYNHSYADLSVLLESMCLPSHGNFKSGIGLFYGKDVDWWKGFKEVFFDEYCDVRRLLSAKGKHHNIVAQEIDEELQALEQSLKADIEMMKDICSAIPPRT